MENEGFLYGTGGSLEGERKTEAKVEEAGNHAVITGKGRITTLEGLLDACQVDRSIWMVERHIINKWEVGAKEKQSNLDYEAGAATGFIREEGLKVHPLFQIKAWMVRKEPIEFSWPSFRPITINPTAIPRVKITQPRPGEMMRAVIIPDSQNGYWRDMMTGNLNPFHDRFCWDIAVQVVREVQPHVIILLGDMLDLPDWSTKFVRSPEVYFTTQPALLELSWWLSQLRLAAPGAEIRYIEGNHCKRIANAVATSLIAAAGLNSVTQKNKNQALMSVPTLLGLDELGIIYEDEYPNGVVWLNDNLSCQHGTLARKGGGNTTSAAVADARHSLFIGHCHRVECSCRTAHPIQGPRTYKAISPGTIGRIDGLVPGVKKRQDWQQGLSVCHYQPGNGIFTDETVNIYGRETILGGVLYEGKDRSEQIRDECGILTEIT